VRSSTARARATRRGAPILSKEEVVRLPNAEAFGDSCAQAAHGAVSILHINGLYMNVWSHRKVGFNEWLTVTVKVELTKPLNPKSTATMYIGPYKASNKTIRRVVCGAKHNDPTAEGCGKGK